MVNAKKIIAALFACTLAAWAQIGADGVGDGVDVDVGVDVGTDIETDVGIDVGTDIGADIDAEVGADIGADIGTDVVADAGAESVENVENVNTSSSGGGKGGRGGGGRGGGGGGGGGSGGEGGGAAREETRFRLSGILEAGFDINNRVNDDRTENSAIARGEIEISARPIRRLRAEIGIEYNHRDTFVTIDKFYAQYSPSRDGTIRAGIMKKTFGLEERAGAGERYFHRRSEINEELEDLGMDGVGFLGHDLTLMYRHDLGSAWRFVGAFSWSLEDSLIYLQNYSAQYERDSLLVILAAILRHRVPEGGMTTTFATSLSLQYRMKNIISDLELTLATHPFFRANGRDSYIYGVRLQEQFPITVNKSVLQQIIPVAEIALLYRDDYRRGVLGGDLSGQLDTQIRGGLTLAFTKNSQFQWRNTFGMIMRTQDDVTETRRYRFDSQAVVVF